MKISQIISEDGGFTQGFKQGFNDPIGSLKKLATTPAADFSLDKNSPSSQRLKDNQNIVPLKILDQLNQLDLQQRNNLYNSIVKNQIDRSDQLGNSIVNAGDKVKNRVVELIKPRR